MFPIRDNCSINKRFMRTMELGKPRSGRREWRQHILKFFYELMAQFVHAYTDTFRYSEGNVIMIYFEEAVAFKRIKEYKNILDSFHEFRTIWVRVVNAGDLVFTKVVLYWFAPG